MDVLYPTDHEQLKVIIPFKRWGPDIMLPKLPWVWGNFGILYMLLKIREKHENYTLEMK